MSETYYPLLAMVLILLASLLSVRFAVSVAIIETAVGVQTSPTAGVRRRRVTHKGGSVFKKILVANNGSDCARRTLETAVELAGFYGADLCMISVEEHLPHYAATVGQVLEEQAEEDSYFAGVVRDAREVAAAHGVKLRTPGGSATDLTRISPCSVMVIK